MCVCYYIVLKKKKASWTHENGKHYLQMVLIHRKKPLVLTDRNFLMKGSFADVLLIEIYPIWCL